MLKSTLMKLLAKIVRFESATASLVSNLYKMRFIGTSKVPSPIPPEEAIKRERKERRRPRRVLLPSRERKCRR